MPRALITSAVVFLIADGEREGKINVLPAYFYLNYKVNTFNLLLN